MKTYWAYILPVLLATLAGGPSKARAQWAIGDSGPAGGGTLSVGDQSQPSAASGRAGDASQVPLGVPSMLGLVGQPNAGGQGPTVPASYAGSPPPGMMGGPGMPPGMAPGMAPGMPPGMMPGMVGPAMAGPGMMGPGMPPQGVMPASYESPMMGYPGGMGCPTCGGMGGAGCPTCSAAGYGPGYGEERGFDFLRRLLPYPAGGWASPRWFDVSADFVYITRDETAASRVDFMSDGPRGFGPPNVVLSTDDLDFDEEPGFRATAAFQIGPSGNIEFTYLGTFHWASSAAVSSEFDELYSAFSDFGTNPPPVPGVSPGGFQDSDAAEFASLGYSSEINSYELSFRRRWMFPNSRVQGSWLAGARYFRLEEEIQNFIVVNYDQPGPIAPFTGGTDFLVATDNSMTGFQLGGDLWATVFPGLLIGVDGRGGIYGNRAEQTTFITTASSGGTFVEQLDTTEAAFVGEANVIGVWRVNQHLSLRGGYQVLYVDGVALAPDNVNFQPPAIAGPGARTAMINANGEALYHGLTAGLELMW